MGWDRTLASFFPPTSKPIFVSFETSGCSSSGCWASCCTHRRSVLYTLVSFDVRALSFFCPCCSTWRRWVVDIFASSDTSGLGSPDILEGGNASLDSFDEWGVVVSWRGCVEEEIRGSSTCRAVAFVVWYHALSLRSTLCHMAVRLFVELYTMSSLSTGGTYTLSCVVCCVVVWLLCCRLARVWWFSLSFGRSRCCFGHYCRRWVERWSVGSRNEGKKGPPSGSSLPLH